MMLTDRAPDGDALGLVRRERAAEAGQRLAGGVLAQGGRVGVGRSPAAMRLFQLASYAATTAASSSGTSG
jgi:hypothetical protein